MQLNIFLRAGHKSEWGIADIDKQIEDLEKARRYLNDYIQNILLPQKNRLETSSHME